MDFKIFDSYDKEYYRDRILELLEESDNDFQPPLSKRSSTKDQTFTQGNSCSNGILSYYTSMNSQMILGALDGDRLVGFVSFSENFEAAKTPNIYISTLVVAKAARGAGLTSKMYDHLFNVVYPERTFYTRTWSTNIAHTKILMKFGFSELKRIVNDRGVGIDTVYYEKDAARTLANV